MKKKNYLLIGGSGNLGTQIKKSRIFKNLISPKKKELNLIDSKKIKKFLSNKKIDVIINCASMARMKECQKNSGLAIDNNILGTFNLVKEIQNYEKKNKKKITLVHISSDAVYPSKTGNYGENSKLGPYNIYGWTKLSSEFLARLISNHIIIRTRFFDPQKLNYKFSASDIYTSQLEIKTIPRYIYLLLEDNFVGIINVGGKKVSDYNIYKKFKPKLKSFKRANIVKKLGFEIAKDASLNLKKFNKIKKKYE